MGRGGWPPDAPSPFRRFAAPPSPAKGGGLNTALAHPLARSGRWLSSACGRRTARGPSLTVSRSTSRARSPSPLGSSTRLSCAAPRLSVHSAFSANASNPNSGSSAARLVGQQPLQMLRIAAGDGGRDRRHGDAAVDPIAGERQPPSAQMALLKLAHQLGNQPLERLTRRFRMRRRLFEPKHGARRRIVWRGGQRVGLRPSIRSSASTTSSAPRNRRASASRGMAISAPMVFKPSRSSVRTVSGSSRSAATGRSERRQVPLPLGRGRRGGTPGRCGRASSPRSRKSPSPRSGRGTNARQRPGRRRGRSNRGARRESERERNRRRISSTSPSSPPNRCATPLTSSLSPSAIDFDQRRPAAGPARQPLQQRLVARRIGRDCNQAWIERSGVGQPRAGPRAAFGGGLGDGMDDRPVGALDGEDDRRVRR